MALQQGGLGLVLTTLIITAPPMAAAFFQGTLGQFTAYSALGHPDQASQDSSGRRPQTPARDNQRSDITSIPQVSGRVSGDDSNSSQTASGKMGNANNVDSQRG